MICYTELKISGFSFKVLRNFCSVKFKHLKKLKDDDYNNHFHSCRLSMARRKLIFKRDQTPEDSTTAEIFTSVKNCPPHLFFNKNLMLLSTKYSKLLKCK